MTSAQNMRSYCNQFKQRCSKDPLAKRESSNLLSFGILRTNLQGSAIALAPATASNRMLLDRSRTGKASLKSWMPMGSGTLQWDELREGAFFLSIYLSIFPSFFPYFFISFFRSFFLSFFLREDTPFASPFPFILGNVRYYYIQAFWMNCIDDTSQAQLLLLVL